MMRVALLGYGAVAAVHAKALAASPDARLELVVGPDPAKARAFAGRHGIARAAGDIADADIDVAIIASPSALHAGQAIACLERGWHVLVELPATATLSEAQRLATAAQMHGRVLQCAHTSRYLHPYRMIGAWLAEDRLGAPRSFRYQRAIAPRRRSWEDDALLHHAAHPLDLLLHWFGDLAPVGCIAHPQAIGAQDVALLARLPNGASASIGVTYDGRVPSSMVSLVGEKHMIVTDGFSFIKSDDPSLDWRGDERAQYEGAVAAQDQAFLAACAGGSAGVPWRDYLRLITSIAVFQSLGSPS